MLKSHTYVTLRCLFVALAAVIGVAVSAHAEDVRIIAARPGWQTISLWYATDEGFWAKNKVTVSVTSLDSSASVMEAFISGQANLAIVNIGTAVNAFARGVPLRIIAGTPASDYPVVAVSPKVAKLDDLRGKKIGVWSIPNDATLALDVVLKEHNLVPGRDFTYVRVPNENICDTLERGQVDAGVMFEPYASACLLQPDKPAHRIAPVGTVSFDPPKLVASSVVVVNESYLKEHADVITNILRAMNQAVEWAAKNKPEAVKILAKYSGQPANAIALSYDSVNFHIGVDRDYNNILLKRYLAAGLLKKAPSEADLKTLYQTNLLRR